MRLLRLALASSLLGLPFSTLAQSTAAPAPRFYGGVGLYSSNYNVLGGHYGDGNTVPVQAMLGYQLRPRLAVQASFAYSTYSGARAGSALDFYSGMYYPYASEYRNQFTTISVLGRYTLTRQPTHRRFQFDALAGFTREHYSYDGNGSYFYSASPGQPATAASYDGHSSNSVYLLSIGADARCRLSQHFELVYEELINADLDAPRYPHFSAALGLRYRFGQSR